MFRVVVMLMVLAGGAITVQEPRSAPPVAPVRAIDPPETPFPDESLTAGVSRFSFIDYGDTRCRCTAEAPYEVQPEHARVVDAMLSTIQSAGQTSDAIRFVLSTGDAVIRGQSAERWAVFTPIVERLTRGAGVHYFFTAGNHDVTTMPPGDPNRTAGLHNLLGAMAKLMPPEGSPRRLNGYPTYAFGYGNAFFIAIDSNIAADRVQLAWVTGQLEHLDRSRYPLVFTFFHHPLFSSGPHSGVQPELPNGQRPPDRADPSSLAMRALYTPLFRTHHVRMTFTGHEHLFEHWAEAYVDGGVSYRRDDIVSGGGGAPTYTYRGEPDVREYLTAGAAQQVRLEHITRPGLTEADNPFHFVVVHVNGDQVSFDVVKSSPRQD